MIIPRLASSCYVAAFCTMDCNQFGHELRQTLTEIPRGTQLREMGAVGFVRARVATDDAAS
jgi:hypothetical protein